MSQAENAICRCPFDVVTFRSDHGITHGQVRDVENKADDDGKGRAGKTASEEISHSDGEDRVKCLKAEIEEAEEKARGGEIEMTTERRAQNARTEVPVE